MTFINVYTSAAQDGVGTRDANANTLIEEWNGMRKERNKESTRHASGGIPG